MQIHAIHWPLLALGCALAAVPVAARAQEGADIALPADGAPSPDDSAVISLCKTGPDRERELGRFDADVEHINEAISARCS